MSLTAEQKKELLQVLEDTSGPRKAMFAARTIPDDYRAFLNMVEQTEEVLTLPGAAVPVRVVISKALDRGPKCPLHVNFHGGGFVLPQDGDDDLYCAHVAAGIHGIVVDVDYALADEHPFPAAFDQCYAVIQWAFANCEAWDADSRRVSAGGHSAGGNLLSAISIKNAITGDFKLCLQVLDYAANDCVASLTAKGQERSRAFSLLYADGDEALLSDIYLSPVFAKPSDLKNQPDTLIVEGGLCPFTPVNRVYAKTLEEAGNRVSFASFPDSRHGFTIRMQDDWRKAQQAIIDAICAAHL